MKTNMIMNKTKVALQQMMKYKKLRFHKNKIYPPSKMIKRKKSKIL